MGKMNYGFFNKESFRDFLQKFRSWLILQSKPGGILKNIGSNNYDVLVWQFSFPMI
jgi:hypothetical protein